MRAPDRPREPNLHALRRTAAALAILTLVGGLTTAALPHQPPDVDAFAAEPFDLAGHDDTLEQRQLADLERADRSARRGDARIENKPAVKKPAARKAPPRVLRAPPPPPQPGTAPPKVYGPPKTVPPAPAANLAAVIRYALAQVGDRYVWGAAGPDAWDCSGLIMMAYATIGIRLPHQSGGIAARGRTVPRAQARAGDVAYYSGHVGLVLDPTRMVHASRAGVPVKVAAIYGSPRIIRIVG